MRGYDDGARHFVVEVRFLSWGREGYSDLFKHAFCFCNPLNTGVVIISGLHPANPSVPYTLWFDRFLQRSKGKLLQMHVFV